MRFSTKTLIYLVALLSVVLAASRFCWVHWPRETQSFLVGAAAWAMLEGLWRGTLRSGLPHNAGRIMAFTLSGVILMVASRISLSSHAAGAGFTMCALTSLVVHRYGRRLLTWVGVESHD